MEKKTILNALSWSFIGTYGNQVILFTVGIILARILEPKDFGLISMILVFSSYGQILIDLGFNNAIIQDKHCDDHDISTVFYLNILIGILLFIILFFSSNFIANFYKEPKLADIIKAMSFIFIFFSFSSIQRTLFIKKVDFKSETIVITISSIISGFIAIIMALKGYGVWALVVKILLQKILEGVLFWYKSDWKPLLSFKLNSLKKYLNFSMNITGAALLNGLTQNIDRLIIGKITSIKSLGFYDRGMRYSNIIRSNLGNIFGKVMFPVFSQIQDDKEKFLNIFRKTLRMLYFLTIPFFITIFIVAKPLIVVFITAKWLPAVIILKILVISGFTYPVSMVMIKAITSKGRADVVLKLDILKVSIFIGGIFIGASWGMTGIVIAITIVNFIALTINILAVSKIIGLKISAHLKDLSLPILNTLLMLLIVYGFLQILPKADVLVLITAPLIAFGGYLLFSYFFNKKQFLDTKRLIKELLFKNQEI